MGLLDTLTGRQESTDRVPPLAKALAGLLTYGGMNKPGSRGEPGMADQLEGFFKPSATGGPTAKGVIGALLTGGMMDLVQQFRGAGKADTVDSWIAPGPNKPVSPNELAGVLSEAQVAYLTQRSGLSRDELLAGLSQRLPQVVDELTPDGRLPTPAELERKV